MIHNNRVYCNQINQQQTNLNDRHLRKRADTPDLQGNKKDDLIYLFEPQFGEPSNLITAVIKNGFVTIGSTTYSLGHGENIPATQPCNNPFLGTTGKCSLISNCPELTLYKGTVEEYRPHFCKIGRYAGVCCPPKKFPRQ
ncbi:hypothetical protein GWI33_016245 [Rhynchophorus ferrugineus]|uniref:Clip domain-containing protein n=1 Tax=Rhynchophorus ferrugineus TaxID=354439 RepID=A0A834MAJ8_RHYFE|nr:hypothetical protein GWI33_016245 [Rhynchophorus ferrugineus]